MPNHKGIDFLYNKIKENQIYHQITPKKTLQKGKMGLSLYNNKSNSSINNSKYQNINNILERNKLISNYTMINNENNPQGKMSKKILLTKQEIIYKNNNKIINENKPNIKNEAKNEEENYNIKYKKNNYTNRQNNPKNTGQRFISKNYYGYDDRYNLEGAINNHSYFESIYSRKKRDQKDISHDKILK